MFIRIKSTPRRLCSVLFCSLQSLDEHSYQYRSLRLGNFPEGEIQPHGLTKHIPIGYEAKRVSEEEKR
jgi:hypothetical protein